MFCNFLGTHVDFHFLIGILVIFLKIRRDPVAFPMKCRIFGVPGSHLVPFSAMESAGPKLLKKYLHWQGGDAADDKKCTQPRQPGRLLARKFLFLKKVNIFISMSTP